MAFFPHESGLRMALDEDRTFFPESAPQSVTDKSGFRPADFVVWQRSPKRGNIFSIVELKSSLPHPDTTAASGDSLRRVRFQEVHTKLWQTLLYWKAHALNRLHPKDRCPLPPGFDDPSLFQETIQFILVITRPEDPSFQQATEGFRKVFRPLARAYGIQQRDIMVLTAEKAAHMNLFRIVEGT